MRYFFITLLSLTLLFAPVSAPVFAAESGGASLFSTHCAGCHPQGKNIIRRGKTLKQKALQRNGLDTVDAIASLTTNGKNNMPAYQDKLSAQEILAVSTYVLEQAERGWR